VSAAANPPRRTPLFDTGQIVATPGALRLLQNAGIDPRELLARHVSGDWGDLGDEDKQQNDIAVHTGEMRLFSSYLLSSVPGDEKVWCITEWDRSVTTLLLPSEY
jgi:hypothetical protein